MDKVKNFRDLGGIETADGRRIKSNLFFRSAFLDEADDSDIAYLRTLGIKKIFDYRDVSEVSRDSEIVYKKIGAKHMHYPNNITKGKVYKLQNGGIERAFLKIKSEDVCEFYRCLPFSNVGYCSMVEALVWGDVPFLQHCAAGKDRAGVGTALLLAILGVPYEAIVDDYMKSLEVKDYLKEKIMSRIPLFLRWLLGDRYDAMFIVDRCYLDAVRDEVLNKYGSLEAYLQKEFGLTPEGIQGLRDKYTE